MSGASKIKQVSFIRLAIISFFQESHAGQENDETGKKMHTLTLREAQSLLLTSRAVALSGKIGSDKAEAAGHGGSMFKADNAV